MKKFCLWIIGSAVAVVLYVYVVGNFIAYHTMFGSEPVGQESFAEMPKFVTLAFVPLFFAFLSWFIGRVGGYAVYYCVYCPLLGLAHLWVKKSGPPIPTKR